jgi:flagellar secretion chaperone FliS
MTTARDTYLAAEVRGASPQKLQLMLVEAACAGAQRGAMHLREGRYETAVVTLVHVQELVAEMTRRLDLESGSELVQRVAAVYTFVARSLREAVYRRDAKKVDDAVSVLEIERETWRQVCQNVARERGHAIPPPHGFSGGPETADCDSTTSPGFSLEA